MVSTSIFCQTPSVTYCHAQPPQVRAFMVLIKCVAGFNASVIYHYLYIRTGRQKPQADEPPESKMTPEEKAEKQKQQRKEYLAKHREEMNARKHQWYIENHEYALKYQKAYDAGIRIGKHGKPKGGYSLSELEMHQDPDFPGSVDHVFYTIKNEVIGK